MNIQFGGSNSSQIAVFKTRLGKIWRDVYCTPEELSDLFLFVEDIRNMRQADYEAVVEQIQQKAK